MNKTYTVEGMHCVSCVQKITDALNGFADTVVVTLNPPQAILKGDKGASLETLNASLAKAGNYRLRPAMHTVAVETEEKPQSWFKTYYPLFLIILSIATVSIKGSVTINDWMLNFMAGFFIVFGFFKLLDLKGFRDAYATYDLLAKRWFNYGLVYPFLELGLGYMFLFRFQLNAALLFSIVLMLFSSLGVIKALREKRKIRCACLGTVLNLPMSTITLVEDIGMAVMAVFMLAAAII